MAPEESSIAANGVDAKERGDYHHYYTDGAYQAPLVVPSGMAWTRVQDYRMPDASGVGAGALAPPRLIVDPSHSAPDSKMVSLSRECLRSSSKR